MHFDACHRHLYQEALTPAGDEAKLHERAPVAPAVAVVVDHPHLAEALAVHRRVARAEVLVAAGCPFRSIFELPACGPSDTSFLQESGNDLLCYGFRIG